MPDPPASSDRPDPEAVPFLEMPVGTLRGAGPRRAERLANLGIGTIGDLLAHAPVSYLDRSRITPIRELRSGSSGTVLAKIRAVRIRRIRRGRGDCVAELEDATGRLRAVWFGQPYHLRRLSPGAWILASGLIGEWRGLQLQNPEFEVIEEDDGIAREIQPPGLTPVYPLTAGIGQKFLRSLLRAALDRLPSMLPDPIPEWLRDELKLPDRAGAIRGLHAPSSFEEARASRERLAFEELLLRQLLLRRLRRQRREAGTGRALRGDPARLQAARRQLGFSLTSAQEAALREILRDLQGDAPAARLLQGDVGCGKTAVAALACAWAASAGAQSCLMAPTEVLALQHRESFERILTPAGVRVALLIGSTPVAERRRLLPRVAAGEVDLLVGTHALLEGEVVFRELGFVVVDEQHRFGVMQRARLSLKGSRPHLLAMSATPIPRTLALAFYGDLDITTIDELPPGRTPVRTRIVERSRMDDLLRFAAGRLRGGSQAFFVYPLIEESEARDRMDATRAHARIAGHPAFAGLEIALLHGRVDREARDRILAGLRAGAIHGVVATTVIEVGLDLPRATLMVIEHAERFGLSQLHQLRGRIGRAPGEEPLCLLIADTEAGSIGRERIEILAREPSGFRIAEEDLRLRGPGEILGTRQAGIPRMRIADPLRDSRILGRAREAADMILEQDPDLDNPCNLLLRKDLECLAGPEGLADRMT